MVAIAPPERSATPVQAESAPAAFDSARAALARNPIAVFAVSVRPVDSKGSIGQFRI